MKGTVISTSKPRRLVLNRATVRRLDETQLARVNGGITTVFTQPPTVASTCDKTICGVNTTGD